MNRASIPGFYFDEAKGKFFQIQKNHQALPAATKYTKENVAREEQLSKRRKLEHRQKRIRQAQTTTRSALLESPLLSGIAMLREIGTREVIHHSIQRDSAYASELRPTSVAMSWIGNHEVVNIKEALPVSGTDYAISAYNVGHYGYVIPIEKRVLVADDGDRQVDLANLVSSVERPTRIASFGSPVMSVSVGSDLVGTSSRPLVVVALEPRQHGNVFVAAADSFGPDPDDPAGKYLKLGKGEESLWHCAVSGNYAAIGSSENVYLLDLTTDQSIKLSQLDLRGEYRALDWLNHRTLAAGQNSHGGSNGVVLWDVRSRGATSRFKNPGIQSAGNGRSASQVTGVRTANKSEHQLLVSSHDAICLFDTRFTKPAGIGASRRDFPLLRIPHHHEGPQLALASNGSSLIAAPDQRNALKIYSTITGGVVKELLGARSPESVQERNLPRINQVAFDDAGNGDGGPLLRVCQGHSVVHWSYGGVTDDEG